MQSLQSVSPRDLAGAIGVSESSVRRWVDGGRIPSARTSGGHRRIALPDAIAYVRSSGLTLERPSLLGIALERVPEDPLSSFHAALERGDESTSIDVLLAEYARGRSLAELVDQFVRPAMQRIGELWIDGTQGILAEHRATAICIAAMHRLRSVLPEPGPLCALGGALSGDPYALGSLAAATVLLGEGMKVVDLGPNTPLPVIREAMAEHVPKLVWLSLGYSEDYETMGAQLLQLIDDSDPGHVFVVGGRGLDELPAASRPNLIRARSMAELAALGRGLVASL